MALSTSNRYDRPSRRRVLPAIPRSRSFRRTGGVSRWMRSCRLASRGTERWSRFRAIVVTGNVGHDMRLNDCHNFHDFRELAKRRLPGPIFDYIDGAADDEATLRQNTASFERCDLVPNVLRGVEDVDLSVTVMGQKLGMPIYCSPTALQRLFHH